MLEKTQVQQAKVAANTVAGHLLLTLPHSSTSPNRKKASDTVRGGIREQEFDCQAK